MTRIGLEGMQFQAFHGYYEAERKMGSTFFVDVFVELKKQLQNSEDIDDTVNYEHIYTITREEMKEPKKLLETVTFSIAQRLKDDFPLIEKVHIRLKKAGPQLGGKVKYSVIEYVN